MGKKTVKHQLPKDRRTSVYDGPEWDAVMSRYHKEHLWAHMNIPGGIGSGVDAPSPCATGDCREPIGGVDG